MGSLLAVTVHLLLGSCAVSMLSFANMSTSANMQKWVARLSLLGFSGTEKRRDVVLRVLEANSADVLDFLVFDTSVSEWDEIESLTAEESVFLENVSDFEKNIKILYVITFRTGT